MMRGVEECIKILDAQRINAKILKSVFCDHKRLHAVIDDVEKKTTSCRPEKGRCISDESSDINKLICREMVCLY